MPIAKIIAKTWLKNEQILNCPWQVMRLYEHTRSRRPSGGEAVILQPYQIGKVVRRYTQEEDNAIYVRIPNNYDIIAVYVRTNLVPLKPETFWNT